MLSQEEFQVLEDQITQLKTENAELQQKIGVLHETNLQIPIFKEKISKIKQEIESSNAEYEKSIEDLNAQLKDTSSEPKSPSKTLSINSLLGFPDDIQLSTAKSKLESENEKFNELVDEEIQVAESLEKAATKEQILSNEIQDYVNFLNQCFVLKPQIETCLGCGLYLQDLCTELDLLRKERSKQNGRKYRLKNWIKQTSAVHESQLQILEGLNNDILNLTSKNKQIEDECHQIEIQLRNETTIYNQEEIKNLEALEEKNNYEKETENIVQQKRENMEKMRQLMPKIDEHSEQIKLEIASFGMKKQKMLQKKLEMIKELKRRIVVERKNQQKQEVNSDLVMELTQVEEQHHLEKEQIEKEIKGLEDKLHWLQVDVEKKRQILEELDKTIYPMDEPVSEERCLKMFYQSYDEVQITNNALLNDMQATGMELAGAEGENESLKTILSQLE